MSFITAPNKDAGNFITVKYTHYGEYQYFGNFIVSFGYRGTPTNEPDCYLARLWANDELIFDAKAGWYKPGLNFVFYPGTEDQEEIHNGFHYRGLICVYLKNFCLTDYGDSFPAIRAELLDSGLVVNEQGTFAGISDGSHFYSEFDIAADRVLQLSQEYLPGLIRTNIQTVRLSTKALSTRTLVPSLSIDKRVPWQWQDALYWDVLQRAIGFISASSLMIVQENTAMVPTDKYVINVETGERLGTFSSGTDYRWDVAFGFRNDAGATIDNYFIGFEYDSTAAQVLYVRNGRPALAALVTFPAVPLCLARGVVTPGTTELLVSFAGSVQRLVFSNGEHPTAAFVSLYTPPSGTVYMTYFDPRDQTAVILVRGPALGSLGHIVKVDMTGAVIWTSEDMLLPVVTSIKWKLGMTSSNLIGGTLAFKNPASAFATVVDLNTGAFREEQVPLTFAADSQMPTFWDSQSKTLYTNDRNYVKIATPVETTLNVGDVMRAFAQRVGYDDADIITNGMEDMEVNGYVLTYGTTLASVADGFGQLYGFSWVERSGQIIFSYGYDMDGEVIISKTVPADRQAMLTETLDNTSVNTVQRTADDPMPNAVSLTYFNLHKNYEQGYQSAKRTNYPTRTSGSVGKIDLSLPVVLTNDVALKLTYGILYRVVASKNGYAIRLPSEYMVLDPTDIIQFTAEDFVYTGQITQLTLNGDNSVSVALAEVSSGSYPVTVAAQSSLTPTKVPIGSPVNCVLFDVPSRSPTEDRSGQLNVLAIVGGYRDNTFGGAQVQMAIAVAPDDWVTRLTLGMEQEGFIGFVDSAFEEITNPFEIDDVSVITVKRGNIPLSKFVNATDSEMEAGANLVVLGQFSTPEYLSFGVVNIVDADTVELSHLMRGRYGTDPFVNMHSKGDALAFLDNAQLITYPVNQTGQSLFFRALGIQQPTWQADIQLGSPVGNSRKPYAPIDLEGFREENGDITFTWKRRARFLNDPPTDFETFVPPLDEDAEAYIIEIYNEDWTILLQQVETGPAPFVYDIASQIEDSTNTLDDLNVLIYQRNFSHIERGFPSGGTIQITSSGTLAGTISGGGTVSGILNVISTQLLAGTILGNGTLTGNLTGATTAVTLSGAVAGNGTVKGNVLVGNGDPYFNNVVLLMHMEGTNGQTTTVDSSQDNLNITGNGAVVLAVARKEYGNTSSFFDDNYANFWDTSSIDMVWNNGTPFTIELSAYIQRNGGYSMLGVWGVGVSNCAWYLYAPAGGDLTFTYIDDTLSQRNVAASFNPTLNTWHKFAVDYDGTDIRVYFDGVMVAKAARVNSFNTPTSYPLRIGSIYGFNTYAFPGFIDELRITKGVARYASDSGYTVATAPFPDA